MWDLLAWLAEPVAEWALHRCGEESRPVTLVVALACLGLGGFGAVWFVCEQEWALAALNAGVLALGLVLLGVWRHLRDSLG